MSVQDDALKSAPAFDELDSFYGSAEEEMCHLAYVSLVATLKDGKRSSERSEAIWRAIDADVLCDADVAQWCRLIAKDVVENVIADRRERRDDRALQALRLGRNIQNADEKAFVKQWLGYWTLSALQAQQEGKPKPAKKKIRLLAAMRAEGFYDGLNDKNAMKRIDTILSEIKIPGPRQDIGK
jgi:hypothetical protein